MRVLEADEMTPGQLYETPENFRVYRPKLAIWKVGGIKIERTRALNFFADGQEN